MKIRFAALLLTLCLLLAGSALAGEQVPEFTLQDQYGNAHSLSGYAGKIVFLNFWATWCPPCRAEMPDFEDLYHELGENEKDIVILGIAAPGSVHEMPDIQTPEDVASVLKEMRITYPVLMDTDAAMFNRYIEEGYPTSLFILPDGTLAEYTMPGSAEKGDRIVGMIDKEYFLQALEEIRAALPAQE